MNLVAEIKALKARRGELIVQVEEIDRQLAEVREMVGVEPHAPDSYLAPASRRVRKPYTGKGSGTRERILELLSVREPQTSSELKRALGVTTAHQHLALMVADGTLHRKRITESSKEYSYARSAAVLDGNEHEQADQAEQEALEARAAEPG